MKVKITRGKFEGMARRSVAFLAMSVTCDVNVGGRRDHYTAAGFMIWTVISRTPWL